MSDYQGVEIDETLIDWNRFQGDTKTIRISQDDLAILNIFHMRNLYSSNGILIL